MFSAFAITFLVSAISSDPKDFFSSSLEKLGRSWWLSSDKADVGHSYYQENNADYLRW